MNRTEWNDIVKRFPNPQVLQTYEWGEVKNAFGWKARHILWHENDQQLFGCALMLERSASSPIGSIKIQYTPRGPNLDWKNKLSTEAVLSALETDVKESRSLFSKVDPFVVCGTGIQAQPGYRDIDIGKSLITLLTERGWIFSPEQIQFKNTVILDLQGDEDVWLARMKQKTRYNLRLAQKKGVTVRQATEIDLSTLFQMYQETSLRDGFLLRPKDYYLMVWKNFMRENMATGLIAEAEGSPIAGLMLFHFGQTAWYLYGMSLSSSRELMPNYLLQWEAMKLANKLGCKQYDLWGAPNDFNESDSMWGVYRFKEGLGGNVVQTIGAWDYPARKNLYRLFTRILPKVRRLIKGGQKAGAPDLN